MIGKYVRFNSWGVLSLLLMVFILALAVPPALANPAMDETGLLEASHRGNLAADTNCETIGVLGREGGLLSLLGGDGYPEPVAAIVKGEAYALQAVHNGQSATYVVYIPTGLYPNRLFRACKGSVRWRGRSTRDPAELQPLWEIVR